MENYSSAHSPGVYGHAVQAKASRTDRAMIESSADESRDTDDTGDVSARVGRSVIVSSQTGQS